MGVQDSWKCGGRLRPVSLQETIDTPPAHKHRKIGTIGCGTNSAGHCGSCPYISPAEVKLTYVFK